jgi:hypothetical protein
MVSPSLRCYSPAELADLCKRGLATVERDCIVPTIRGGMPAPPLNNTFEGGSDGTTITTANSGGASGDALTITTGAGSVHTFASDRAANGVLSMKIVMPASGQAATRGDWTGLGSITTNVYYRMYFSQLQAPGPAARYIIGFRENAGSGLSAQVRIQGTSTNNILRVDDKAAAPITALDSTTQLTNTTGWYRIECRILSSTTVGEFEWRLFLPGNEHGTTPDETKNATGQALAANTDSVRTGMVTNALASETLWFDEIAVSTVNWIGPAAAPFVDDTVGPVMTKPGGREMTSYRFGPF